MIASCIIVDLNEHFFFFSIEGKLSGGVNWEGVNFYNFVINELLSNG